MPSTATDVIDGISTSVAIKPAVKAVAITNITLAGEQTVNGRACVEGDRVLAAAQTNAVENGNYVVSTGQWQRSADMDGARDVVQGTLVLVRDFDGVGYELTTANPVIGTSNLVFELRDFDSALRGDLADSANGDALVAIKYAATSSAALNLHDYVEDDGYYNVMGFIPQALKSAIRNFTSTTDLDVYLQAAIDAAVADMHGLFLPRGRFNINAGVSKTFTGNRITNGFRMIGAGKNSTILRQTGAPTALVTFQSATPTIVHTDAQMLFGAMTMQGVAGKTAHGLSLLGIAGFRVTDLLARQFDSALNLASALVGIVDGDSQFADSNTGIRARKGGTAASCNAITIRNCRLTSNSSWGLDFNQGSNLKVRDCDIEANGTAANTSTGGVLLGNTIEAETGFGYGTTLIQGCWFEANLGRTISVAAQAGGIRHYLAIENTGVYSPESTRAIFIAGAEDVAMRNVASPGATDVWNITAVNGHLEDCFLGVLTDGITYPNYINVETAAVHHLNGRIANYTGTLTQCTTAPTATIQTIQRGKSVEIFLDSALTATSANVNAPRITGMPAGIRPGSTKSLTGWNTDNSADKVSQIQVLSGGDIVLANGASGAFTAANIKGSQYFRDVYEVP